MKLNLHETHDRYLAFMTQKNVDIGECCQNLIDQRPYGLHPFYIFVHPRTLGMDQKFKLFSSGKYKSFAEIPEKTLVWQPRLTKPKAETNSMLFKGYPGSDMVKLIWMIPSPELWSQYEDGKVTENETIINSIRAFRFDKESLERNEDDDLSDSEINAIYQSVSKEANYKKRMKGDKIIKLWETSHK